MGAYTPDAVNIFVSLLGKPRKQVQQMHPGTLQIKWLVSVPLLLTDVHGSLCGLVCACLSLERARVTNIAVKFGMDSFSAPAILAEIVWQVTSWQK